MQRSLAEHEHAIKSFFFDGPDEPFAVGVQIRTAGRQEERFHTAVLQQRIKRLREFRVPVVDQVAFAQQEPLKGIRELPRTLLHEGSGRVRGDAGDLDLPSGKLHDHEHVVRHQAMPRGDFYGEEVGRGKHLPMKLQKLRPAHTRLAALRGGLQVVATQDVAHGQLVDMMPQIR